MRAKLRAAYRWARGNPWEYCDAGLGSRADDGTARDVAWQEAIERQRGGKAMGASS